jgi:hypothetical protein
LARYAAESVRRVHPSYHQGFAASCLLDDV